MHIARRHDRIAIPPDHPLQSTCEPRQQSYSNPLQSAAACRQPCILHRVRAPASSFLSLNISIYPVIEHVRTPKPCKQIHSHTPHPFLVALVSLSHPESVTDVTALPKSPPANLRTFIRKSPSNVIMRRLCLFAALALGVSKNADATKWRGQECVFLGLERTKRNH